MIRNITVISKPGVDFDFSNMVSRGTEERTSLSETVCLDVNDHILIFL